MGCGGSKSKRIKPADTKKHKVLTEVIKAAEKLEATCGPANEAFEQALRAMAQWATEEDTTELRATAEPLRAVAQAAVTANASAESAAAALATAFANVAAHENEVDAAARELGRAEKAKDVAEARANKLVAQGSDAQDAQVEALAAKDAVTTAREAANEAIKDRDAAIESVFATALINFAVSISKQQEAVLPAYEQMLAIASDLPSQPSAPSSPAPAAEEEEEEGNDTNAAPAEQTTSPGLLSPPSLPRPKGRPSIAAVDYGTIKSAVKAWEACSRATADHSHAMRSLFTCVHWWGATVGDDYRRRSSEVNNMGERWTDAATPVVAKLNAAVASCNEVLSAEKEVDDKWRSAEAAEKAKHKHEKKKDKIHASLKSDADAKEEAKQAADLAAAAHEETLQHLRDKAEITAALKLKEFKTSLAAVATTQAARATEVRAIFDEMAARLSESSPPPYAGNNVASTAVEEDKPYEGGGAGAKASSDPRQPSDPTVVVVVVDSTPQSGGDPKPTPDTKKPPSEVVDTETQTKSSNGTTQDEAEASADADTSMSKAAAAAPESSQVDSESSAEKIPAPSTESAPEVEKTAM